MKNISKYLGAGLLLFTAACSQTQEGDQYTPNKDDAKAIHFIQSSIQKEFPQDAVQGVINVEIARPGNKGAYKVYLATKDDDYELFSVPAEATIPDGSHSVTVPVEVDLSNFVMGSNYKTTLYICCREARPGDNAAQVAQYSDKVTLSATYELEWETLYRTTGEGEEIPQLATYHYNGYYSGRDSGLEVEKAVGANIFRLKDWASGVTFKFVLHDDNTCTVPAQSIGYYNSNYNEYVYVADMAVYTGNDSAYASYPCTFDGSRCPRKRSPRRAWCRCRCRRPVSRSPGRNSPTTRSRSGRTRRCSRRRTCRDSWRTPSRCRCKRPCRRRRRSRCSSSCSSRSTAPARCRCCRRGGRT